MLSNAGTLGMAIDAGICVADMGEVLAGYVALCGGLPSSAERLLGDSICISYTQRESRH